MTEIEKDSKKTSVSWRDIVRFTMHYWRPRKGLGISSALLMIICVSLDAVIPVYTGKIVNAMTGQGMDKTDAAAAAWSAFAMLCGVSLVIQFTRIASVMTWNNFAVRNLHAIVIDGLRKVQRFSSDWHANAFAGATVRKISRGMWAFDMLEDQILLGLLPALTIMVSVTAVLTLSLPLVGMTAAVMILIYCAFSIWVSVKILAPKFKDSADADTKMGAMLADIVTGNPTVKSFGRERHEDGLFQATADTWRKKSIHAWQTGAALDGARSLFRFFMTTSMIAVTIFLWGTGKATPGDIVTVVTTFFILSGYLRDVGMHIAHLQRAVGDMEDAVSFWLRQDDLVDCPDARDLVVQSAPGEMISFDTVAFHYPNGGKAIYDGLSVSIGAGENIALVGPSGSGKSTFVKLVQRLYDPTSGMVTIQGQDISRVTLESLRQSVSLVPQDPVLFHRSIAENISYGRPGATRDEIEAAARKAFAHDFIIALPQGYDTLVGERGVKLSGGERQRVAIARAILSDAPILILDEATSSLDSISEHYIQAALADLMRGRTTITIAHRLSTIQRADRIFVFDKGAIVDQGSHAELMARPASPYRKMHDMQVLGLRPEEEDRSLLTA